MHLRSKQMARASYSGGGPLAKTFGAAATFCVAHAVPVRTHPACWFRRLAETIFPRARIPLVIPDQASHGKDHRNNRPS
jgi:hypothetical protein